ncbi:pyridoxal phosphate-dependent decarboxylase family protein [Nonomuraea fastidiosa]|uniref:pyridoxal phosphate-dependent decarboxylase family protein n=1 Tax=Nonomuraea fastidiosa TaxID=46173 RepID=UPI00366B4665
MTELDVNRPEMAGLGRQAVDALADWLDALEKSPASDYTPAEYLAERLRRPPAAGPGDFGELVETFLRAAGQGVNTAGPGYLAYFPAGGLYSAALAELLANAVNRYTGLAQMAPALVAMEHGVLTWLCERFGLPPGAGGITTSGGSTATLSAVLAARQSRLGDDLTGGTLYVTAHTHHCVAKAARICGLPAGAVRQVPMTGDLRMDVRAAAELIAADRAAGLRPFLLAGTAGTTGTGTIDPLPELAGLAAREGLWFHVDAAYGGGFQLTERGRPLLAGIERADSIAIDPHKSMFLPYGTGVLLVRDPAALHAAHADGGDYLQDLAAMDGLPDFANLGVELTREFRGAAAVAAAAPARRGRLRPRAGGEARPGRRGAPGAGRRSPLRGAVAAGSDRGGVPAARGRRRAQPPPAQGDQRHPADLPEQHERSGAALPAAVRAQLPYARPPRRARTRHHQGCGRRRDGSVIVNFRGSHESFTAFVGDDSAACCGSVVKWASQRARGR